MSLYIEAKIIEDALQRGQMLSECFQSSVCLVPTKIYFKFAISEINDPTTSEAEMNAMIDAVADALFAVCATMGVVPIIRCRKDNAAELVAKVRSISYFVACL